MAHTLTADLRNGNLDATLFADDSLVFHALVLAAQALVVLDRTKDAGAEQAVPLRLERAVVDRLRLLDLAVRPRQNLLRARDGDPDLVEHLSRRLRAEEIHHFLVHLLLRLELTGRQTTDDCKAASLPLSVLCRLLSVLCYSAASAASPTEPRPCLELCRSTLRPSERISFT